MNGLGNGPAGITLREAVEKELRSRGYYPIVEQVIEVPKYTREQVIKLAVDYAINLYKVKPGGVPISKWNSLIAVALKKAHELSKAKVKKTVPVEHPAGLIL